MLNLKDKVSIITPAWNSEKYIVETIKSVQKQTYTNWEMIIVDDCSTDKTVDIVKDIAKYDSRIKILMQPENYGAAKARTRGMEESTGRFIAYLDADDIWKEKKLEKQISFMKEKNADFLVRLMKL